MFYWSSHRYGEGFTSTYSSKGYRIKPPIVKPTRLTSKERGGVGKNLSDGWVINYAIGCTHGCVFCYVDSIHKRYSRERVGPAVDMPWGEYFVVPENLWEAIEETPWTRWSGVEVLMSSTHDPYLPQLYRYTRAILEKALSSGIRIRILTRSLLAIKDLDLLSKFKDRVKFQVSIATMNEDLARIIEPRVPSPSKRISLLREAKETGISILAIVAPVFPPNAYREDLARDLDEILSNLAEVGVDYVYGESLHIRGSNILYIEKALEEKIDVNHNFDRYAGKLFTELLGKYALKGEWWYENYKTSIGNPETAHE
jgi:DNA repair photolyase